MGIGAIAILCAGIVGDSNSTVGIGSIALPGDGGRGITVWLEGRLGITILG